jgi:GTP pyrophosphokinase
MVAITTNLPAGSQAGPEEIDGWLASLAPHYAQEENERLRAACALALSALPGQELETGETRLRHNLATAEILAHLHMDAETLQAAVLNGVLAVVDVDAPQLEREFGPSVAQMAANMERLSQLGGILATVSEKEQQQHAENLRRLLLGIAEDVRAVLVVLAERLHLMRASKHLPEEVRRRMARENRDIYAPLANRLGIWQIKWELEDMSLRYLEAEEYRRIASSWTDGGRTGSILSPGSLRPSRAISRRPASTPRSPDAPSTSTASTARCTARG